eukprot:NODE_5747_length_973_cov_68.011765_g5166_i0.p1 GENE.NODE_5747_length_973_cov_68.011765_g5166_i0~~NODE_5747_length_973_cov_68.011765_g5166_i0.p1  ORF type:complete len:253 (+),score=29.39 NODE_5747_length_973_cov_68.011765_g5166_i0:56-760(+)
MDDRQEKAKKNLRFQDLDTILSQVPNGSQLYNEVLRGIASNVKMGPFTATSGVVLPYYLNASTNFLDKHLSPKIAMIFSTFLIHWLPRPSDGSAIALCGPEMAGGILAAQMACLGSPLNEFCDYIYVRKEQKSSGTCQQLEGPVIYTSRNSQSPPINGVWLDDAMSTGSSIKSGIIMMKERYNIIITHALYLVDRTKDRADLPVDKQHLADPLFDGVDIKAIFDLDQVDSLLKR